MPLLVTLVVAAVAASIVLTYAERAIAIEDVGTIEAIQAGWRLFRGQLGESLLAWVVNAGLSIAAALVILAALLVLSAVAFLAVSIVVALETVRLALVLTPLLLIIAIFGIWLLRA